MLVCGLNLEPNIINLLIEDVVTDGFCCLVDVSLFLALSSCFERMIGEKVIITYIWLILLVVRII